MPPHIAFISIHLFAEPDELRSMQQLAVYLRRWRPSTFTLDPFQEVVLSHQSVEELRQKVHLGMVWTGVVGSWAFINLCMNAWYMYWWVENWSWRPVLWKLSGSWAFPRRSPSRLPTGAPAQNFSVRHCGKLGETAWNELVYMVSK